MCLTCVYLCLYTCMHVNIYNFEMCTYLCEYVCCNVCVRMPMYDVSVHTCVSMCVVCEGMYV